MLHLSIAIPGKRVLFSIFVPEDAVDGLQLGTLVKDLNFLEPFGLPEATIAECKLYDFVSAQVGSESSKFAGTSIGKLQQMADILAMGVTSISVIVRPREAPMSSTETGEAPMSTTETGRRRSFLDVLVRTQVATFPDWGGGGNKAYGVLYAALKVTLVEGGFVGFKDEAHGLKFMKSLVQILYGLSTFWGNFAHRRAALDPFFAFSEGANDWKKKKIPVRRCSHTFLLR